MRVLTVIAEMGSGGAESVAGQLATAWTDRGHDVVVATSGGWRADAVGADGRVRVLLVPLRGRGPLAQARSAWRLGRELRRTPADVVHAHNVRAAVVARVGVRLAGSRTPVVCTVHGLPPRRYPLAVRLLRRCADEVVAVSGDVAARLVRAGLPGDALRTVPNAADPGRFAGGDGPRATTAGRRARVGLPPTGPVVLCVARMAPPKRHDLLLEAWRDHPGLGTLVLVGDGAARPALRRRAAALGLAGRVVWLGDQRELGRLLSAADVLVLPTDAEGMPVSVLEAMALGVPVVASAVGGLLDLPGDAVRLVRPGHAADLAAAVGDLLDDGAARTAQVAAARAVAAERYSAPAMVAAYEEVLSTSVLRGGRKVPRCDRGLGSP